MNAPLAAMLRYNRWANLRLFEECRGLSDALLDARVEGVSGSVRTLLLHLAGGQQTFVLRTQGRQHEGELSRSSAWPGVDALLDVVAETSDRLVAIAEALDEDVDVDLPWQGKAFRFPRSFFLVHAVEHGVEHRTEVKVALAHLGVPTPDLDAWSWAPQAGFGAEV
ncbi:MAG: DinB family protein [Dehalococcoidia bacterium]